MTRDDLVEYLGSAIVFTLLGIVLYAGLLFLGASLPETAP